MSKRTKWLLAIGVIAALVVGWQVAAFASHPEASLPGSNFEIDNDANLKVDDQGSLDWANVNEIRGTDKPTGQTDDSYQGGVKEDTTCPAETTGTIPNNKSDLRTFHVYREAGNATAPQGFLNIAWSRVTDPTGTTLMDFEFNRSGLDCTTGPNKVRSAGDLLIEYSIDQGGARANITARTWNGTSWGAPTNLDVPSTTCGGNPCAAGTINSTPIPAAESDGIVTAPNSLAARTFGEAQIDLRLLFQPNKCSSLGAAMLKSRSSDSFTSQLKDFIRPQPVNITNCGKVIIHKNTVPDETDQNFSYTKSFNTDPTTPNTFQLNDNDADGGVNKVPDTITFDNVLFGSNYTVTEGDLPAGWKFDSLNCNASSPSVPEADRVITDKTVTFKIDDAADVLECTYTNSRLSSTLSTEQSFIPQDTATVGGEPNTGFNGTVDFRLYTGSNCTGTLLYEELNQPLSGTTAGSTATTNNDGTPSAQGATDGYTITGDGTFSWKVTYEGDTVHPNVESCVENSTVSITNGGTASNPPAS